MGILDGLELPERIRSCKVRTTLDALDEADKEVLAKALENEKWKAATLSDALRQRGIELDGKLITRHRNKLCSCVGLS